MNSPLSLTPLFTIGPVDITAPVVVTWAIMLALVGLSVFVTRKLTLAPSRLQAVLELLVETIDGQIRDTMLVDPAPYRPLIGSIFLLLWYATPGARGPNRYGAEPQAGGAAAAFA